MLNDRTDRVSGSSDYLWTDETLVRFINEAQRRFAVKGLVLRDGTTDEVTKITLVEGQTTYVMHPSVISVISLRNPDHTADIRRVGHSVLSNYSAPTDNWSDPAAFTALQPGAPLAFSTDEGLQNFDDDTFGQVALRVHPTPAAAQDGQVLRARVVRKPLEQLRVSSLSMTPEIPEDHHIEMLDWAAYLALRIVDDDAGALKHALMYRDSFEQHVKEARTLLLRKLHAPMDWGFGRGGFSWS